MLLGTRAAQLQVGARCVACFRSAHGAGICWMPHPTRRGRRHGNDPGPAGRLHPARGRARAARRSAAPRQARGAGLVRGALPGYARGAHHDAGAGAFPRAGLGRCSLRASARMRSPRPPPGSTAPLRTRWSSTTSFATRSTTPGVPTIAAALAVAEDAERSGLELLKAVVVGYEISTRIGAAVQLSATTPFPYHRHGGHVRQRGRRRPSCSPPAMQRSCAMRWPLPPASPPDCSRRSAPSP